MILVIAMLGCSVKGTVELMRAERAYDLAEEKSLGDSDEFNWTMADAYIKKSREEYANSNYEIAGVLARKCQDSLQKIQPIEVNDKEQASQKPEEATEEEEPEQSKSPGEQ